MSEIDFTGLRDDVQAAFRPRYTEVVRRAARRRTRVRTAGATLVAVAAAGGAGVAAGIPPGGSGAGPTVTPTTAAPRAASPLTAIAAGDLEHLFLPYRECAERTCAQMLAVSSDRGATWRASYLPVPEDVIVLAVTGHGPDTVVVYDATNRLFVSTDRGRSWRTAAPRTVPAIPDGWSPLPAGSAIRAIDPATGDVVQLAGAPRYGRPAASVPPGNGLWLAGLRYDHGREAAVAVVNVSHDGGRTWVDREFTASANGGTAVASHDGSTGYVVVVEGTQARVYRTVDGGRTWQPSTAQLRVHVPGPVAAAVRPDGTLIVRIGSTAYASDDRGTTFREVADGPGAGAVWVPGGYVESRIGQGAWLSADGREWTRVAEPSLR